MDCIKVECGNKCTREAQQYKNSQIHTALGYKCSDAVYDEQNPATSRQVV